MARRGVREIKRDSEKREGENRCAVDRYWQQVKVRTVAALHSRRHDVYDVYGALCLVISRFSGTPYENLIRLRQHG